MQERELRAFIRRRGWQLYRVYSDKGVSGVSERRPGLDELVKDIHQKKFDVLLVWKIDRLGRSLRGLVQLLELLRVVGGISFVSCTEAIDTSLPHGEMLFQIIGAIAQWERSLISERVRAGLQHARARGKRLGRPALRVLTPKEVVALRQERRDLKTPYRMLATKFRISVWAAHSIVHARRKRQ
jgi:DNA invertase Pin-like site-specific DNA recombinase